MWEKSKQILFPSRKKIILNKKHYEYYISEHENYYSVGFTDYYNAGGTNYNKQFKTIKEAKEFLNPIIKEHSQKNKINKINNKQFNLRIKINKLKIYLAELNCIDIVEKINRQFLYDFKL